MYNLSVLSTPCIALGRSPPGWVLILSLWRLLPLVALAPPAALNSYKMPLDLFKCDINDFKELAVCSNM